jgi:hypothetical protein
MAPEASAWWTHVLRGPRGCSVSRSDVSLLDRQVVETLHGHAVDVDGRSGDVGGCALVLGAREASQGHRGEEPGVIAASRGTPLHGDCLCEAAVETIEDYLCPLRGVVACAGISPRVPAAGTASRVNPNPPLRLCPSGRPWPARARAGALGRAEVHPVPVGGPPEAERQFDPGDRSLGNVVGVEDEVFAAVLGPP